MFTKSILFTALGLAIALRYPAQNNSFMKNINQQAPVKGSRQIAIHADGETVWNVLTNINQWAAWNNDISQPKLNGELKSTVAKIDKLRAEIDAIVAEIEGEEQEA